MHTDDQVPFVYSIDSGNSLPNVRMAYYPTRNGAYHWHCGAPTFAYGLLFVPMESNGKMINAHVAVFTPE